MERANMFEKQSANANLEVSAYLPEQLPQSDKPEIVFSGKSNVGKSSMINRLLGKKNIARVSSAPGKTASVNFYSCGEFRLVDLPGYGYAKVPFSEKKKWSELVDAFFDGQRHIVLVIQLIDVRRGPAEFDTQMLDYLKQTGLPHIIVMTKSDKLKKSQLKKAQDELVPELKSQSVIYSSAETGQGIAELKKAILSAAGD